MNHSYANMITDALCTYLNQRHRQYNFQYHGKRKQRILSCEFSLKNRLRSIPFAFHIYDDGYNTYAQLPIAADPRDPAMMYNVMTYINRINHNLRDGNFEVNSGTGKIRYRYFMNCEDIDELLNNIIHVSVSVPLQEFEHYGEGFVPLIYYTMSEEQAFVQYQKDMEAAMRCPDSDSAAGWDSFEAFDADSFPTSHAEDADMEEDPFEDFDITSFLCKDSCEDDEDLFHDFDADFFLYEADGRADKDADDPFDSETDEEDILLHRRPRRRSFPGRAHTEPTRTHLDQEDAAGEEEKALSDSLFDWDFDEMEDDFEDDTEEIAALKHRIKELINGNSPSANQTSHQEEP